MTASNYFAESWSHIARTVEIDSQISEAANAKTTNEQT